jgi:hypothetical protein
VWRLVVLLNDHRDKTNSMQAKTALDCSYRNEPQYLEAISVIRNTDVARDLDLFNQYRCEDMIKVFMDGIKRDPTYPSNYVFIGYIYRFKKDYEEALKWFLRGVNVDVKFKAVDEFNEGYKEVRRMRTIDKGPRNDEINKIIDAFVAQFSHTNPNQAVNFLHLDDAEIDQWVESDIREIIRIVREEKIGLILQNYPKQMRVNSILPGIAHDLDVTFVDNYSIFQDKISQGMDRQDLFIADGHCNARGYGLMAENVFDKIVTGYSLRRGGQN